MYITNQIYGLAISIILFVLFLTTKRLTLKGTSSFLRTIVIVIVCLFFDALSCVAIKNWWPEQETLVHAICKIYLACMVWVGWTNFCYVCLDLNSTNKKHTRLCAIMACVTFLMSLVIAFVPIEVVNDSNGLYTAGPAVISTYIFTIFYILSSLIVAVFVLKTKNRRRGFAVLFSHIIWIAAAIVQAFNNEFLVVGLAMAVGLLILYIVMENPDAHIDRSLECYSSSAFNEYLNYIFEKKKKIYVLDVSVTSTSAMEGKGVDIQKEIKKIIRYTSKKRNVHFFKTFNVGVAIVSENMDEIKNAANNLLEAANVKNVSKNILLIYVEGFEGIYNTYDFIKLTTFARQQFNERTGQINCFSNEFINKFHSLETINNEILKALDEDRVEVFYQPIYNTKNGTYEIAEALCRIRNKDGSLMSPGTFIPVAETTGSIGLLGERIFNKVCDFCSKKDVESLGIKQIDVNLSAVQCDNVELAQKFSFIAKEKGVNPNLISFEITETAFSSVKSNMLKNMNELIGSGFEFSLDDFGKGASNLMYAIEMPIKVIKLDMELTQLFMKDKKAKAVVNAIIKMSHDMNLFVVSEGVENQDEANIISNSGIDYIQGYFFSKPLPEDEYIDFVKKHHN